MKYYNKELTIPEIINKLLTIEGTISEKSYILKNNWNRKDLRFYIDFMYNGDKTRKLIGELPSYNKSTFAVNNYMQINTALGRLTSILALVHTEHFDKKHFDKNLKLVLESVSAEEAECLFDLFSGKKHEGGLKKIFKEAYPEFFRTDLE